MYYREPRHPRRRDQEIIEQITNLAGVAIERKRTYDQLQRSEAYLTEGQRVSHTGSFGWNVQTGEIRWSEETFRIFQCDPSMKPNVELVLQRAHPEDVAFVRQEIERASQDRKDIGFEHRLLMPDGSVKHVRVAGRARTDKPGELEFVGAVTDITGAKRAEEALRRSETYLAEAQRLSRTGSWAYEAGGGVCIGLRRISESGDLIRSRPPLTSKQCSNGYIQRIAIERSNMPRVRRGRAETSSRSSESCYRTEP